MRWLIYIAVAYLLNYIIVVFEHNYIENAINKTNGTVIIVNFSHLHYVFSTLQRHKIGWMSFVIGKIKEVFWRINNLTNVYSNSLIKKNLERLYKEFKRKFQVCSWFNLSQSILRNPLLQSYDLTKKCSMKRYF